MVTLRISKHETHDGAAADDADEDDEGVVVEIFTQHEHAGIGVVGVAKVRVAVGVASVRVAVGVALVGVALAAVAGA